MERRRIFILAGLALLVFAIVALLDLCQPLAYARIRNLYRDWIARAGRTTAANPDLVFLAIDAASVSLDDTDLNQVFDLTNDDSPESRALHLMSRRFPWSREIYALVLERLVEAGAKVVAFDLVFPGPTDDDTAFRAAIERYADHVVIGSNFVDGTLTRPSDTLVPQTAPMDRRVSYTNFWADDDEVVRRAQFHVTFEQVRGVELEPGSERFVSLAANLLGKAGYGEKIPPDLFGRDFRFTGPPRAGFAPRSLFEIFVPRYWKQNYGGGAFFRGKIVLIGAEGNWQHDEHPTPFGNMPGPELHLNAINAAIHQEFIQQLPPMASLLFTALAAAVAMAASLLLRSPWIRLAALALFCAGGVAFSLICFNYGSFYFPVIAPTLQFGGTMLLGIARDLTSERLEKTRVRRVLERYVSRDVVRELVNRPHLYAQTLGGVTRPVVILFSDIRSYSAVTARSEAETLVGQLNEYFTAMVDCVFENDGTLDKFIGDALMAVWGGLQSAGPQADAVSAVKAALSMQEKLVTLNESWKTRGWPELRVGMAIHYGEVVVGNIGSPQRMEFTVIGDAVNMTWRLQELTKKTNTSLLVSESVATLVQEHFELCGLEAATIDQSHQAWEIYTVVGPTPAQGRAPALANA